MGAKVLVSIIAVTSAMAGTVAGMAGWTAQPAEGFALGPDTWIPLGVVIAAICVAVTATWRVFRYMSAQDQMNETVGRLHGDVALLMTLMLGARDPKTDQRVNGLIQRFDDRGQVLEKMDRKLDQLLKEREEPK